MLVATVPGALLVFQGQFSGRRFHMPVQLARWPVEASDSEREAGWLRLLSIVAAEGLRSGRWSMLDVSGWPDNDSCHNLLAWQWQWEEQAQGQGQGQTQGQGEGEPHRYVIVVNFSGSSADGRVALDGAAGADWDLTDLLDGQSYPEGRE